MGHSIKIFSCELWILYILVDSYVSFLDDAMLIYAICLTLGGADWCMLSQRFVWQDLPNSGPLTYSVLAHQLILSLKEEN